MSSATSKIPKRRGSVGSGFETISVGSKPDSKDHKGERLLVDKKKVEAALQANSNIRRALKDVTNNRDLSRKSSAPKQIANESTFGSSEVVGLKSKVHVLEQRYLASNKQHLPNTPGANQAYHSDSSPSTDKESVATPTSTASDIRGIVVADDRLTIELKATVDRLTTENNDLKKTNSELLEQLNNSKRMRLTKDVELTALKAVNDSLQHHQIAVRAENEALHRNLAALKVENDRLQQELSTFCMENENLVRQLAFLQSELDTIATSVMSSSPQSRSYSAVKGSRSDARDCEYSVDSNWLVIDESESEISLAESSTCADHDTAALQRMLQATFREKLEAEKQIAVLKARLAQLPVQSADDSTIRKNADALLLAPKDALSPVLNTSTQSRRSERRVYEGHSGMPPKDFPDVNDALSPVGVCRSSMLSEGRRQSHLTASPSELLMANSDFNVDDDDLEEDPSMSMSFNTSVVDCDVSGRSGSMNTVRRSVKNVHADKSMMTTTSVPALATSHTDADAATNVVGSSVTRTHHNVSAGGSILRERSVEGRSSSSRDLHVSFCQEGSRASMSISGEQSTQLTAMDLHTLRSNQKLSKQRAQSKTAKAIMLTAGRDHAMKVDYIPHKTVFVDLDSSNFLDASDVSYAFSDWHRLGEDSNCNESSQMNSSRINFLTGDSVLLAEMEDGCDRSDVVSIGVSDVSAALSPNRRGSILARRQRVETPEDIRRARRAAGLSDRSRSYANSSAAWKDVSSRDSFNDSSVLSRSRGRAAEAAAANGRHVSRTPPARRRAPYFPTPDAAMHSPRSYRGTGTDIASDVGSVGASSPEAEPRTEAGEIGAPMPSIVGMLFSLFQVGGPSVGSYEQADNEGDCDSEDDEEFARSVFSAPN